MPEPAPVWRLGSARALDLSRARIMAIVNATPDSFSDGGRFRDAAHAAEEALRMLAEGADLLDIGGESTRPGAAPVDDDEQIRRVVPVIEALRAQRCAAPISVDTTRSDVARAALDAGADAVNDQSSAEDDPRLLALVAERSAGLVLMHRLRKPDSDSYSDRYASGGPGAGAAPPSYEVGGGVVASVRAYLADRLLAAERAGVARSSVAVDPGLGFGKTVEQNLALVAGAGAFTTWGCPVVCAASRKSFIGAVTGVKTPSERVEGSIAVAVAMRGSGASIFRVHDIKAHRRALDTADSIRAARDAGPPDR